MKNLIIAALIAAQLVTGAQPALAAELTGARTQTPGAFAGLRLRVPLDGQGQQRQVRAGLAVAPTMHSRSAAGESRSRIGEGVELGLVGREPVRLSLGGTPVNRLAQSSAGPNGQRLGVSTAGWIAIGLGTAVAVAGIGYLILLEEIGDCDDGDC